MRYRAHLLGGNSSVAAVQEFESEDDFNAAKRAAEITVGHTGLDLAGFDLWQETRHVAQFPNLGRFAGPWPAHPQEQRVELSRYRA